MNAVSALRVCIIRPAALFVLLGAIIAPAQQRYSDSVIQEVDAAVKGRIESIASYTVTEHYSVYRNKDESHPVAEMTVNTTYQKDTGKSYVIVAKSGSEIIHKLVLSAILENEKRLNLPSLRDGFWITSTNYSMNMPSSETQLLNGTNCQVLSLTPRRKAPYLIEGTLWIDAKDGSIVQVQGTTTSSASFVTGSSQVIRQYANIDGFAQATHFRAVSNSFLLGQTIVTIDYMNYHVHLAPTMQGGIPSR